MFHFHLRDSVLQIVLLEVLLIHGRYEDRCVGEEIVHFFKRSLRSFRLNGPEEECVCEIADDLDRY